MVLKFKSLLLHHSVSRFPDIAENRSKSARVRAICDRARTRRMAPAGLIAKIRRNLSGRDLPRSADHRHSFAHHSLVTSSVNYFGSGATFTRMDRPTDPRVPCELSERKAYGLRGGRDPSLRHGARAARRNVHRRAAVRVSKRFRGPNWLRNDVGIRGATFCLVIPSIGLKRDG